MSEQESNRISDNLGDVIGTGPIVPNSMGKAAGEPTFGPVKDSMNVESPKLAPEPSKAEAPKEASKADSPGAEVPKVEIPKSEPNKAEAPKIDVKADAPKPQGKILVMPREQAWNSNASGPEAQAAGSKSGLFGKRRVAALAAVVAVAAMAGALGGALATAGFGRGASDSTKVVSSRALEDAISRVDTEIAALRTSLEQASKHSAAQFGKAGDRLDKVEKAQAEPAAKLAKLSETVDKLRTAAPQAASAPVAAAAPVAPKETTGTIQAAAAAPVPVPAPKPEVARLPTVEGWVLRDVANGSAVIEGRQGMYEVFAGDPIPGLGRVDAIRKQHGRWVVVTSKGLIVAR